MYTDQDGRVHYEANETFDRVVRYVTTHMPQIVTAGAAVGLFLVAVKINKHVRSTDLQIDHALGTYDKYIDGMLKAIPQLHEEGRDHTFYPGIGVWVEEAKEIADARSGVTING